MFIKEIILTATAFDVLRKDINGKVVLFDKRSRGGEIKVGDNSGDIMLKKMFLERRGSSLMRGDCIEK